MPDIGDVLLMLGQLTGEMSAVKDDVTSIKVKTDTSNTEIIKSLQNLHLKLEESTNSSKQAMVICQSDRKNEIFVLKDMVEDNKKDIDAIKASPVPKDGDALTKHKEVDHKTDIRYMNWLYSLQRFWAPILIASLVVLALVLPGAYAAKIWEVINFVKSYAI